MPADPGGFSTYRVSPRYSASVTCGPQSVVQTASSPSMTFKSRLHSCCRVCTGPWPPGAQPLRDATGLGQALLRLFSHEPEDRMPTSFSDEIVDRVVSLGVEVGRRTWDSTDVHLEHGTSPIGVDLLCSEVLLPLSPAKCHSRQRSHVVDPADVAIRRHQPTFPVEVNDVDWSGPRLTALSTCGRQEVRVAGSDGKLYEGCRDSVDGPSNWPEPILPCHPPILTLESGQRVMSGRALPGRSAQAAATHQRRGKASTP